MAKYVAKRFVSMLITLFLVATVTFFLMHAVPGQPFEITRETPDSVKEALYEQYGLNKPLFEQYLIYMKNLLHGDFGVSMKYKSQTVAPTQANGLAKQTPAYPINPGNVKATPVRRRSQPDCICAA